MATCSIDGCDNDARLRGWCKKHHTRWVRHGDPHIVKKGGGVPKPKRPCTIDGCSKPQHAKEKCSTHYQQERYGHVPKPSRQRLLDIPEEVATYGCVDCRGIPMPGGAIRCLGCFHVWLDDTKGFDRGTKVTKDRHDPGRTPVVQARVDRQLRRWVA